MSTLERYAARIRELEDAKRAVFDIARAYTNFGRQLERAPTGCFFAGIDLPCEPAMAELLGTDAKAWDATDFPGPDQVNAAIRRRVAALAAAQDDWEAIPADLKISTLPPRP